MILNIIFLINLNVLLQKIYLNFIKSIQLFIYLEHTCIFNDFQNNQILLNV